jgi:hypothetical protein
MALRNHLSHTVNKLTGANSVAERIETDVPNARFWCGRSRSRSRSHGFGGG